MALGRQRIAKYAEAVRNDVIVAALLLRLPAVGTDVVVSLNAPARVQPASSSFVPGEVGCGEAASAAGAAAAGAEAAAEEAEAVLFAPGYTVGDVLRRAAESLRVHDFGLFDAPAEDGGER